jgi:hypothetical protein
MTREKLRFHTNVPLAVSLIYKDGLPVSGKYGDQIMYTVNTEAGERVMYVDPIVGRKIDEAGIGPNEWFRLGKFEVRNGVRSHVEWKVERIPPEEEVPGVATPEPPPHVSARANAPPQPTTPPPEPANGTPALPAAAAPAPDPAPAPRPQTKLEDALKTVVAACHAATLFAKEIGFAMPNFTSEDIAKMAMTLTIEARNGGAR